MKKTYLSVAVAAALALSACGGNDDRIVIPVTPAVANAVVLTSANELWSIDVAAPDKIIKRVTVTGIPSGEVLLGMDYRPSNGKLYGITKSAVYVIDDMTGVAAGRQALESSGSTLTFTTPLVGTSFGVDFNPVVDRMRVVDDTGMSLVINVETGAVNRQANIGTTLDNATPPNATVQQTGFRVTAAAYTNSISKPVSTRLWDIDTQGDRLFQQEAANNNSQLSGEISLGVDASDVNGFDIDGTNNKGYAALKVGSSVGLYAIDLAATANAATLIKPLGSGSVDIKGFSLKTKTTIAYALTSDNKLVRFLPTNPNAVESGKAISGLASGETLLGIDFRPADGKLYGITSSSRIVTINKSTGAATIGGSLNLNLPINDGMMMPTPVTYSVDFNPAADKLRVMNSNGLNLRIDVDKYTTVIDGMLSKTYAAGTPADPVQSIKIIAAAYTNSFTPNPATTMLYDLDVANQSLALQNANAGTFTYQGAVTPPFARATMDIVGGSNGLPLVGLAGATGATSLYTINLVTGATTAYPNGTNSVGTGATAPTVSDIALTFE